jgi:enoyl-CoA hydratase
MDNLVSSDLADGVATITLDDGKVNAISPSMVAALTAALDRAEADGAVVVLAGRAGVFSAGFDLKTLEAADDAADALARGGFTLVSRLVTFPTPVVGACTGHAIALGALLLAACDLRFGATGDWRLALNEVAIGIPLPRPAIDLVRERLHPAVLHRATALAEVFTPDSALAAGWLDHLVPAAELLPAAQARARELGALNRPAYRETKRRRQQSLVDSFASYLTDEAAGPGVLRRLPE